MPPLAQSVETPLGRTVRRSEWLRTSSSKTARDSWRQSWQERQAPYGQPSDVPSTRTPVKAGLLTFLTKSSCERRSSRRDEACSAAPTHGGLDSSLRGRRQAASPNAGPDGGRGAAALHDDAPEAGPSQAGLADLLATTLESATHTTCPPCAPMARTSRLTRTPASEWLGLVADAGRNRVHTPRRIVSLDVYETRSAVPRRSVRQWAPTWLHGSRIASLADASWEAFRSRPAHVVRAAGRSCKKDPPSPLSAFIPGGRRTESSSPSSRLRGTYW